jgi:putative ATPase
MSNQHPLADLLRPSTLDEIVGQKHLVGKDGILRRLLERQRFPNMIFSGPPGTGKTTCANILAKESKMQLFRLNATTASIADIKEITLSSGNLFGADGILLYLDEIQYFNRKQQQSLLEFMEDGRITLIASTTENPYLYIYNAILSRSSVFTFEPVSAEDTVPALARALDHLNRTYATSVTASEDALLSIARRSAGDVRMAITIVENAYYAADREITEEILDRLSPPMIGRFDKDGDVHYDLLSCLQKSIRGSDPDAAVFYLAKLLTGGDLISVCRRLQVIASEDIGAAYPLAATIVRSCVESAKDLGLPEASIPLSNAVIMLATAPKSNSAHVAYEAAAADIAKGRGTQIPEHLRAPLYKGYQYPHDFPNHYVEQQYLPDDLKGKRYYTYGENRTEQAAKAHSEKIRSK